MRRGLRASREENMATSRGGFRSGESMPFSNHSTGNSGGYGVCMMSTTWRDKQHPSLINFISCFLNANSFRLNTVPISPVSNLVDFKFKRGICIKISKFLICRTSFLIVEVLQLLLYLQRTGTARTLHLFLAGLRDSEQFANLYVVATLPTKEQNDSFVCCYFKYGMKLGRPTFIPVQDFKMGFEKMVKIAHARGVCKREDAISKLKAERERSVQTTDTYLRVVTSIPGIDQHDANALNQAIGSIEGITKSSKDYVVGNTDLSSDKAERITRFFRDPSYYLAPKIT